MDTSFRQVRVSMIVLTQSYEKKSPLFLLKDGGVLFKDLDSNPLYSVDNAVSDILATHLGIDYKKEMGGENWVMPQLNNVLATEDGSIVILYSCLVPETSKPDDETLQWRSITDVLSSEDVSEYDKKLISNFATGE